MPGRLARWTSCGRARPGWASQMRALWRSRAPWAAQPIPQARCICVLGHVRKLDAAGSGCCCCWPWQQWACMAGPAWICGSEQARCQAWACPAAAPDRSCGARAELQERRASFEGLDTDGWGDIDSGGSSPMARQSSVASLDDTDSTSEGSGTKAKSRAPPRQAPVRAQLWCLVISDIPVCRPRRARLQLTDGDQLRCGRCQQSR